MALPYTIRRKVSDYRWEYLKDNKYQKFRTGSRDGANKKLAELPIGDNWVISCCGA